MKKILLIQLMIILSLQTFAASDSKIEVNITEGKYWKHKIEIIPFLIYKTATPQIAVWCEDMQGNLIETVYTTEKISEFLKKGEREETLPIWKAKFLKKEESKIDGIGGATQTKGVVYSKVVKNLLPETFMVFAEVNNSFDYNEYYTKNGENGTEKTGVNGQPSLLYKGKISKDSKANIKLELYGCSSSSGKDGNIYKDLSKITTAKEIASSIEIQLK